MFRVFPLIFIFINQHYSYAKSPFRTCGHNDPCDKDFYCDMFVKFCSPCRDICNPKFSRYCRLYCAESQFIKKIGPTPPRARLTTQKLSYLSQEIKVVLESKIWSTTLIPRYNIIKTEDRTEDTYQENKNEGSYKYWYGVLEAESLILAIAIVGGVLTVLYCFWSIGKNFSRRSSHDKHNWNSKTVIDGFCPKPADTDNSRAGVNVQLSSTKPDCFMNADIKCTCNQKTQRNREISVSTADSGIYLNTR